MPTGFAESLNCTPTRGILLSALASTEIWEKVAREINLNALIVNE